MGLFKKAEKSGESTPNDHTPRTGSTLSEDMKKNTGINTGLAPEVNAKTPLIAVVLGFVASIGGFLFGYDTGSISGYIAMDDFKQRFGDCSSGTCEFSAVRQGTIVGLFSIGTLFGCLVASQLADRVGRRYAICASAFWCCIGYVIQITSTSVWAQFAMGRFTSGMGVGSLSVCVPMYQSESTPKTIRGAVVASYQLLITLGIWTAYMVDWGTEAKQNAASWRIPNGLSFIWACSLGFGILFLPESPRFAYRQGRVDEARKTMARLYNVEPNHEIVSFEINEIQEKLDAERAGGERPWYECFTGPRMLYRTLLGIVLQAGQQLTGANFFFYYGTTVFSATGLSNSFVTQIILGSVNVACTLAGLWIVENCGRRKSMMAGAAWMFMCFMIYAFVGQFALNHDDPSSTPQAGSVLIVFTCLFIAAFATTWGPMVWSICAEIYPARYRATCMALATASNWLWNFLISFFTQFITNDIDYFYGLVFGGCCFALFWIVYFFMIETKGRSLEEIDTMYILHVNPIHSAKWSPESLQKDGLVDTDKLRYSNKGNFLKDEESNAGGLMGHNSHEEGAPGPSTTEKTEATA